MPSPTLGPFILQSKIGEGGFAQVWRVRHKERGTPAAIKVLLGKQGADPKQLRSFLNEVRAVAQLDHPGIAWVLDYGRVSEEAAIQTEGRLTSNCPYLAMEFASGGTLAQLTEPCNWTELRSILISLLDALAHAHAHGVIHRDLKPDNVLLCSKNDLRPGIKLTDFGIAFALEDATTRDEILGTPHYMAPEQLRGLERQQGPWTDLYAFGCLVWFLLTGGPPFAGKRQIQLIVAHQSKRPPQLNSRIPLPAGFESWLRTLLEKHPQNRFPCAADAARALIELGHPETSPSHEPLRDGIVRPVLRTQRVDATLPLDWRRPSPPRPVLELTGAGLNLFGLRPPLFTGREPERDRIWTRLTEVHQTHRAQGILIEGAPGAGKSRLARWMATRAEEVGAATVLSARFSDDNALETLLLRHFSAVGLQGEELSNRLDNVLDDLNLNDPDLRRQTHALLGGSELEGASRYASIRLLIETVAKQRPVILLLDDVHLGIDGVRFARHLQNAQVVRPFPVLMLIVARPVADPDSPLGREMAALRSQTGIDSLRIEPLQREPFMELVRNMLGLEPELARIVVERTAGNPQFALQVIGDWVERDLLTFGSRGFKLRPGLRPQLPSTMKAVWVKRLTQVLEDLDPATEVQLEAAALLGMSVRSDLWEELCDGSRGIHQALGLWIEKGENRRTRRALVERLRQAGLVDTTPTGFHFLQSEFRNAILDQARRAKRIRLLHRCAAEQLGPTPDAPQLERYGRHLLAAGERNGALAPLLQAVPFVKRTIGRRSAWRLLDTIEHTMNRLSLPPSDVRWGQLFVERASLADVLGRGRDASRWAAKAGREASRYGWTAIAAAANFRLGEHAFRRGDHDMASARLIRVTNQVKPKEHPFLVGEALFLLGTIARDAGDEEEAKPLLQAGRRWMLRDPDPSHQMRAFLHLARSAFSIGQNDVGSILLDQSLQIATKRGDLAQQVHCLSYAAKVAKRNGRLAAAAKKLRQAIKVFELIGDAQLSLLRCNLASVLLDLDQLTPALQELERALSNAADVRRKPLLLAVQCTRLRALAMAEFMEDYDETLTTATLLLGRVKFVDPDGARSAEQAGRHLAHLGRTERATSTMGFVRELYKKLGDSEAISRLDAETDR